MYPRHISPSELTIAYEDFTGEIGVFRDILYGTLTLHTHFDQNGLSYPDCGRRLVRFNPSDNITANCIEFIAGIELIRFLNPICVT